MKYLITGGNGQLAKAFIRKFSENQVDYLALGEKDLDITDIGRIVEVCDSYRPDAIINCAAYNLVDRLEENYDLGYKVNVLGPKFLARAAEKYGALFVHFSTDYIFDGSKQNGLYTENDKTNPLNRYGFSKLEGEKFVKSELSQFLIFRLSWLFGEGRQNFIYKLIEWSEKNDYMRITCDEFSVPTYTYTVADIVLKAIDEGMLGLYHLPNSGYCSRFEWACQAFKILGIKKFIRPVTMDSFSLPAKRPGFSAMSNENLCGALDVRIPEWQEVVSIYLKEFRNE